MDVPRDQFDRPLRDLRISVTDRCNFRCTYCMPKLLFGDDFEFLPRRELLSFEEITRVSRALAAQGVSKIRLTGGEPLLRGHIEELVRMLASIGGITDIALTTNGSALARKAQALRASGLTRVTVSLDALEDDVFCAINDVDFRVGRVLEGIDAADSAGLSPLKINMVVKRGVNDHCVLPMAAFFRKRRHTLRFIEYMDVGTTNGWRSDQVVPAAEIFRTIDAVWQLESLAPDHPGEVATRYRYRDGAGEIGLIASISQPFCGDCSRIRLSAEGKLYTCLFATSGHDLRAQLRRGATDEEIAERIRSIWSARSDRYSETRVNRRPATPKIEMSYIGG